MVFAAQARSDYGQHSFNQTVHPNQDIFLVLSCAGSYRIRSNYRTYLYKRTLMKFRSLITASVLFIYFFIKAYVVGSHLNCIDSCRCNSNEYPQHIPL